MPKILCAAAIFGALVYVAVGASAENRAFVVVGRCPGGAENCSTAGANGEHAALETGRRELGDGGGILSATLDGPEGLAFDPSGTVLYIADRFHGRVRAADLTAKTIGTVIGSDSARNRRDGDPATGINIGQVQLLAVNAAGELFFSIVESHRIDRFDPATQTVWRFAGIPSNLDFGGDGGPALSAAITVSGMACDRNGDLLISGANRIRRISRRTGRIETIAGTGKYGFFGDGGPAPLADLARPTAIALAPDDAFYFLDRGNDRIRSIDRRGRIQTVAGNGRSGPVRDGGALEEAVGDVVALACAGDSIYLLDWRMHLRRVDLRQHRVGTIIDRTVDWLDRIRESPGLVVGGDGTIYYDVPGANVILAIDAGSSMAR